LTVLIETQYLPCLAFFALAAGAETLRLEKHEHFVKQTFRNRCYINTEHGLDSLHIPLRHHGGKSLITDVRIDHTQKWVTNHWRSVTSAYGKSPFFEYYSDDLKEILFRKHDFLYDLNFELLTLCLRWIRSDVRLEETQKYEKSPELQDGKAVKDYRGFVTPKAPINIRQIYRPHPYHQVFGNAFAENASLIDLVFCCGPEAGRIVKASCVTE
jgi:hypothetical protein